MSQFKNERALVRYLHEGLVKAGWLSFPQNSYVANSNSIYVNGTPDLIALAPSYAESLAPYAIGFECKMERGVLSPDQRKIEKAFESTCGRSCTYVVVRPNNVDDVLRDCADRAS